MLFEGRIRGDFETDRDELLFELDFCRRCRRLVDSSLLLSSSELELDELSDELLLSELDDDDDESLELLLSELDDDDDGGVIVFVWFFCCAEDVDDTSFLRTSLSLIISDCAAESDVLWFGCCEIGASILTSNSFVFSDSLSGDDTC